VFIKRIFPIILISVSLLGCAKTYPIKTLVPHAIKTEQIITKNYTLNKQQKCMVGDTLVRVKDYVLNRTTSNSLQANDDFKIYCNDIILLSGQKKQPLPIVAEMNDEKGEAYYLLQASLGTQFLVPVNKNGMYLGHCGARAVGGVAFYGNSGFQITPSTTKFELAQKEEVDSTAGYVNYEILYTGMTKDAINFLYREYTSEDMARPAFYQNLTYPRDAKSIRFKAIKINLIDINEESVTYAVVEE